MINDLTAFQTMLACMTGATLNVMVDNLYAAIDVEWDDDDDDQQAQRDGIKAAIALVERAIMADRRING